MRTPEAATPIITGVDISRLRFFRYAIEGDTHHGVPLSAFDDGAKAYHRNAMVLPREKPHHCLSSGPEGDGQLVNYRVRQNYYIVDRLFARRASHGR